MTLTVFTDGGSRGNPGPASIGIIGYIEAKQVFSHQEKIGITTNNTAEYTAVIKAFELLTPKLNDWGINKIELKSDSKLLVEQLSGRFKIKASHLRDLYAKVKKLESASCVVVIYSWIKRVDNMQADLLVNKAQDSN